MLSNNRENLYKIIRAMPDWLKNIAVAYLYSKNKILLSNLKTPIIINFFITNRCNLSCSHCFYSKKLNKVDEEISLGNIRKIARSLRNTPISVVLTGGETFLRKDLVEICNLFDKIGTKKIIITTNATLPEYIKEKVEEILATTDLDIAIQISLDGTEKIHDEIRGMQGTYGKVIKTINELKTIKSKRLSLSINTVVSQRNLRGLENLMDVVKSIGIFHGIQFVRSANRHVFNLNPDLISKFDCADGILTIEQMQQVIDLIKRKVNNQEMLLNRCVELMNLYFIKVLKEKKRFMDCVAGYVDAIIYPNGGVSICEFTIPFANLKEFDWDFYKLWKSKKAMEIRAKTRDCVCTHQCNLLNSLRFDKGGIKKIFN